MNQLTLISCTEILHIKADSTAPGLEIIRCIKEPIQC